MASTEEIIYSVLQSNKAEEATELLINNFFPNEPISRALGLPIDQVKQWFPHQIRDCIKQNCSIQAVDKKSGKIVGVAINIVIEKNLKSSEASEGRGLLGILNPDTESVMVEIAQFLNILNQVSNDVYNGGIDAQGKVTTLNCIYLNVLGSFGGKGIGKTLVQKSEEIAQQKKVSFFQVDTTSDFSYRIFHKSCGFPVIREIPLSEYLRNIEKIDNGIHQYGRILLKKINV